jgi:hypothetical protein
MDLNSITRPFSKTAMIEKEWKRMENRRAVFKGFAL